MKHPLIFIAFLLFCSFASFLSAKFKSVDAQKLWQHISVESPYTSWSFWENTQGLKNEVFSHAQYRRIYVNMEGYTSKKLPVGNGTIIVKENISSQKKLTALLVMYKVEGYNPDGGNWFWVKYTPEGRVERAGILKGCLGCHSTVSANDYIFLHEFES